MAEETSPALSTAFDLLRTGRVFVLSGAGISTDSGIPDYRGPRSVPRSPMTYQHFMGSRQNRTRYWARSFIGWTRFQQAAPNAGHRALADVQRYVDLTALVTQNVDRLHQAAGSSGVIDLHGRLDQVICLGCRHRYGRGQVQRRLAELNPGFASHLKLLLTDVESAPDGDAEVDRTDDFAIVDCPRCGGILKPDVVYFGEGVPKGKVTQCFAALEQAHVVLVLGSSLSVMSGLRFVRRAAKDGKPIVIVNDGPTRGDALAAARPTCRTSEFLAAWLLDRSQAESVHAAVDG